VDFGYMQDNNPDSTNATLIARTLFRYNDATAIYRCPAISAFDVQRQAAAAVRSNLMNCYMNGEDVGLNYGGYRRRRQPQDRDITKLAPLQRLRVPGRAREQH
jgi:hypothetical protein